MTGGTITLAVAVGTEPFTLQDEPFDLAVELVKRAVLPAAEQIAPSLDAAERELFMAGLLTATAATAGAYCGRDTAIHILATIADDFGKRAPEDFDASQHQEAPHG